jgi:hypothetical protein
VQTFTSRSILRHRHVERRRRHREQLGHQEVHHAAVAALDVVLDGEAAGFDDELAQQRGHLDDAAGLRQFGNAFESI